MQEVNSPAPQALRIFRRSFVRTARGAVHFTVRFTVRNHLMAFPALIPLHLPYRFRQTFRPFRTNNVIIIVNNSGPETC